MKYIILALISVSITSTAFSGGHDKWAEKVKQKNNGKKIIIAVASHPSVNAFKKMIPDFENLTGIDVVLDEMEEGQLGQKLTLEVSS